MSSEDFEGLIFRPDLVEAFQAEAKRAGFLQVEWHGCLRSPAQSFCSLYAELSKHLFVDLDSLFYSVVRLGYFYVHDPKSSFEKVPYWYFCFDHGKHLSAFAEAVGGQLRLHDYADDEPFPLWAALKSVGVLDVLTRSPSEAARNERIGMNMVLENYQALHASHSTAG